jgi:uncharacterized glyoxalase superfamily protein PhnB
MTAQLDGTQVESRESRTKSKQTVTAHLIIDGADRAIAFYRDAFGATETYRMPAADGRLMHAAIQIGDSAIYLADAYPEYGMPGPKDGASAVVIHLYVDDVDAVVAAAETAGATITMKPEDTFWGDRFAKLIDPFGHHWSVAHTIEELTPAQMMERVPTEFGTAPCASE